MKTYKHKKRGTTYTIIGEGRMSVSADWHMTVQKMSGTAQFHVDMEEVVIYQGEDGNIWVRPKAEFFDGRFEEV